MPVDPRTVTTLVAATRPTLTILVGILINNSRLADLQRSMDQRFHNADRRFDEVSNRFDQQRDLFHADLFRVEQVIDARLKHLEEHR
jgi:hypothetical protein